MTSNMSLGPLLSNHLGPFPDNETMSLHICLDVAFSEKRLSTEKKCAPPPQGEIVQDVPNKTNSRVLMKIEHGLFGELGCLENSIFSLREF